MPSEPMEPIPDINLVDPGLYSHGDPFAQWRWLRAHQPVFRHPETELPPFWALTRYDDIRTAYRDAETFSSAQGILLRPTSHGTDPGGGAPWRSRTRLGTGSCGSWWTSGSPCARCGPWRRRCAA